MKKESNPLVVIMVVAALCAAIYAGLYALQGPQHHAHGPMPPGRRPPGVPEGIAIRTTERPGSALERIQQGEQTPNIPNPALGPVPHPSGVSPGRK